MRYLRENNILHRIPEQNNEREEETRSNIKLKEILKEIFFCCILLIPLIEIISLLTISDHKSSNLFLDMISNSDLSILHKDYIRKLNYTVDKSNNLNINKTSKRRVEESLLKAIFDKNFEGKW
ncbi:MAG: hypothetical protein MJ252_17345, partial [archaeon]|nr:hypothetical protein [archaeon]